MSEHRNKLWFILIGQQQRKKWLQDWDYNDITEMLIIVITIYSIEIIYCENWSIEIIINKHSLGVLKKYNYDRFIMENAYLQNNGSK